MSDSPPASEPVVRLRDRRRREPLPFRLEPDADQRSVLAERLGLRGLRKLRFAGTLTPEGAADWRLDAELGATVVQDCGVTLDQVVTRIEEDVVRRYLSDLPPPPPGETEMPEDETAEPLPSALDLREVMAEALSLALPPFPRSAGLAEEAVVVDAIDPEPAATHPFAALRNRIGRSD